MRLLFTITIFLGAFLLFLVQPLFAKMLLPLLGGSPSVWNTAMVFYQTALLAGYAYAHFATARLGVRRQVPLHGLMLVLPAFSLPIGANLLSSPPGSDSPIGWMLLAMAAGVGLPFFALSATSPLIQKWFAATGDPAASDPYFLYSASNLGSMISLAAYPLLLEPNLKVQDQSLVWSVAYIAFAGLMAGCGLVARRRATLGVSVHQGDVSRLEEAPLRPGRVLRWVGLALAPSSLMAGVTTFISTDIAVVPLLWAIPLGLYLLSFIVAFASRPWIPHAWVRSAFPFVLAMLVLVMAVPIKKPGEFVMGLHLVSFFLAALLCHGELAADRPGARRLTAFYLWMSVGGALGGAFNALLAPILFSGIYEYPLMVLAVGLLLPQRRAEPGARPWSLDFALPVGLGLLAAGAILLERKFGLTSSSQASLLILSCAALACVLAATRPLRFALSLTALLAVGLWQDIDPRKTLFAGRSFFGVYKVQEDPSGQYRYLMHGRITHGIQALAPELRGTALSYYAPSGPAGQVFRLRDRPEAAHVGVVGMGIGSLAAFGRSGETWDLYEICPLVAQLAQNEALFGVLARSSAQTQVVLGDARLKLAERRDRYDILVIDAFSGDSIPAHLITREALEIYLARLKPNGILLMHVTNRHLHFEPLLAALAESLGMECRLQEDFRLAPGERAQGKAESAWAAFARGPAGLGTVATDTRWRRVRPDPRVAVWTDDYSSILSVLRAL